MTTLDELNKYSMGDKLPGFTFARIGDGVRGKVIRAAIVPTKSDRGTIDKLVLELDVASAKGGIVERDGDFITNVKDYQAGEKVAVWLPPGFGIGAMSEAVAAAGAKGIDIGAEVSVKLVQRRDTGKPKPANVYECTYAPPTVALVADKF